MKLKVDMTTRGDQEHDIRCPSVQAIFAFCRKSEFEFLSMGING